MAGVAYRGGIPLEDIEVDFRVEPAEHPSGLGFGVRERVTLMGDISESQRARLQRASRFCPVGQALTKGAMEIEDRVRWSSGDVSSSITGPPRSCRSWMYLGFPFPQARYEGSTFWTPKSMTQKERWPTRARRRSTFLATI